MATTTQTIELAYHPNIRSTIAKSRAVTAELVRETATIVVAKLLSGTEVRISKKTGREEGKTKFVSHYAIPMTK